MQLQESLTGESVSLVLCRIQKHYTSLVLSSCSVHVDCLKTLSITDCVFVGVRQKIMYLSSLMLLLVAYGFHGE